MRILSLTATSHLAERTIRKAGRPLPVAEVVEQLGNLSIDQDRAHAGIRLAVIVGRLEAVTDAQERPCLSAPAQRKAAA